MKKIAPDIYVSTEYPGVNVGFIAVPAGGAIAVDAPTLPQNARAWREQVVETAGGPILYVVLTDGHPDRLLSAASLHAPIVAARAVYSRASAYTDGFWRGVIENWTRRYPQAADDFPGTSALPEVMFTDRLTLHKGGLDVTVERVAGGCPGSAWVYLPERDVLFAGDTLVVDTHPFLEAAPDTKAWLDTLKSLRRARYARTVIVPGRGPLCDQSATQPLSEYLALARRRARSLQRAERARVDKAAVVAELLSFFPVPDEEHDLVQRRVKAGMDHLIEELSAEGE
jgi:glyoxylase-like metal-dependent hydrolase (beta-lactamase superfamily II)